MNDTQEDSATSNDPAQAFDALRRTVEDQDTHLNAEMTVIRKGIEAAFDQFDRYQQPADYSADLGQINKALLMVAKRLQGVQDSPALKNGPDHYARTLERSGESLVSSAVQTLETKSGELDRAAHTLANRTKSARSRQTQNRNMWQAGGMGFVVGILMLLVLPRVLPFEIDTYFAATIMGDNRWNAGAALMRSENPEWMDRLVMAADILHGNKEVLAKCQADARQEKKGQRCTIVVPGSE